MAMTSQDVIRWAREHDAEVHEYSDGIAITVSVVTGHIPDRVTLEYCRDPFARLSDLETPWTAAGSCDLMFRSYERLFVACRRVLSMLLSGKVLGTVRDDFGARWPCTESRAATPLTSDHLMLVSQGPLSPMVIFDGDHKEYANPGGTDAAARS